MKKTPSYLLFLGVILILGGFGCQRKAADVMTGPSIDEQPVTTSEIVPPPPEIIADIKQEGFTESQKQYFDVIEEAPNQDIDYFQAELGL